MVEFWNLCSEVSLHKNVVRLGSNQRVVGHWFELSLLEAMPDVTAKVSQAG